MIVVSAVVLLVVSSILAFLGKPTEMALVILAGSLGMAFSNIDKISKFKGAGFEAEMRDLRIDAILDKETESDPKENDPGLLEISFNRSLEKILSALNNPAYTWRTVAGVSKESGLPLETVTKELINLVGMDYVHQGKDRNKKVIWSLSKDGRNVVNSLVSGT